MFTWLKKTNRYYLFAAIFALIYLISGFIPQDTASFNTPTKSRLTKAEAVQVATKWAESKWQVKVLDALPMYQSDPELEAALIRLDAKAAYSKSFAHKHPIEYYEVELSTAKGLYRIYVDYRKANVVGWDQLKIPSNQANLQFAEQTLIDMGYPLYERVNVSESNILTYDLKQSVGGMQLMAKIRTDEQMTTDFKTYFRIPTTEQQWFDQQEQTRAKFELISTFGSLFLLILAVLMAIVHRNYLYFNRGWALASIYFVIQSITIWNMYPAIRLMGWSESGHSWALSGLFTQTIFYLGYAGFVYLAFVVGDGIWRNYKNEDATYTFNNSPGFTYLLAMGVLGAQMLIYYFGDRLFEVWATNDPWFAMDNIQFPLAIPLTAWAAAIGEEVVYRLFALMALFQLFKRVMHRNLGMFLAILLSSMLWALGHVGYPVFPAISRFVEVTLLGFLFSAIFLRFGLLMSILVHAIINSFLMGVAMNVVPDASTWLFRSAAVIYILVPLLVATLIRFRSVRTGKML
ncbi:MAG: hypothetical protein RLZZ267_14 [Bacillota bacterium]|jgi:hypothetical protein